MEYLQYGRTCNDVVEYAEVLNLVISGIPSILSKYEIDEVNVHSGFKPCYKWNTFNTVLGLNQLEELQEVLNLVISGIPSIHRLL